MKKTYSKYFFALLVSSCITAIVPVQASLPTPVTIAQATATYSKYMRTGYNATAKRDYKTALINFRKALQLRPNNRYASQAISNVSLYAKAPNSDRTPPAPPTVGAPKNTIGAATRGTCSNPDGKSLVALLPKGEALTTAKLPVLLFYMPQNLDTRVKFILQDSAGNDIYKTNITPSKNAGIVRLDLATFPGIPSLENGKEYQWYLSLICDENDPSSEQFVTGFIKKVALDPLLTKELQAAKESDRAVLYAVNGIWYDALATLYQAQLSNPNDEVLRQTWATWLKSVQINKKLANDKKVVQQYEALPSEPLTKCCTVSSSKEGL